MKSLKQEVSAFGEATFRKKIRLHAWPIGQYAIPDGSWRVEISKAKTDEASFNAVVYTPDGTIFKSLN